MRKLLVALVVVICVQADAHAQTLKEQMSGSYLSFLWGGHGVEIYFKPDGMMSGNTNEGLSDIGKWWVDKNKVCREWSDWKQYMADGCFDVEISGSHVVWRRANGLMDLEGSYFK